MSYESFEMTVSKEGHFVEFRLYDTKENMRIDYKEMKPEDLNHDKVESVHCAYTFIEEYDDGSEEYSKKTGIIMTNSEGLDVGVIPHEIMHAVLWAYNHSEDKVQYPIVINNMEEEEIILHAFSNALQQFYLNVNMTQVEQPS